MGELSKLAGVGRKTANVVRGHAFGEQGSPSIPLRALARRLGLTRSRTR